MSWELRRLQKKHNRHFPTLAQAIAYDKANPKSQIIQTPGFLLGRDKTSEDN